MARFTRCDVCGKDVASGTGQRLKVGSMSGEGAATRYIATAELDLCGNCVDRYSLPRYMWEQVKDKDPVEALKDALFAIFDELHADMEHE